MDEEFNCINIIWEVIGLVICQFKLELRSLTAYIFQLEVSEPNWVNSILNIIRVNSLRLGGL